MEQCNGKDGKKDFKKEGIKENRAFQMGRRRRARLGAERIKKS